MRKEELRQLKRINATPLMLKLAKENKLKKPLVYKSGWSQIIKLKKYDMFIRCQTRGQLLMVCLFFPDDLASGIKTPTYELYLNPEGDEFITRILHIGREVKWSSAKIENLEQVCGDTYIGQYWTLSGKDVASRIWQNKEGRNTIKNFLKTQKSGWEGIIEWQKKARSEQVRKKEEREQAPWDADMALVPEILPGFRRFTEHDASDKHYIFYNYEKAGAKNGYCSYCEKQVPVQKPRHNKDTVCPCCGKEAVFKARGKISTLSTGNYYTECIQKIKGGFVIRTFRSYRYYRQATPENPRIGMHEEERYIVFADGTCRHYTWGMYKNKDVRWIPCETRYASYMWGHSIKPKLYTRNLSTMKKTVLKNSAVDLWPKLPCSTTKYLYIEAGNPAIEKLARLKMFKLAKEIMFEPYDHKLLDQNATELTRMLKIDKSRLKRLKKYKWGVDHLRWLQHEKVVNTVWADDMIRDFGKAKFNPNDGPFDFIPGPRHLVKIWNYLKKQAALSQDSIEQTEYTWRDYMNMAEKAKWNTASEQVIYPKNLEAAHGNVILFLQGDSIKKQAGELEEKWPKVNEVLPGIKKFEYTSGMYRIVVPENIEDIVREGVALSHCVHTCDFYFDRIQKHETYLFFLRKASAPDVPWYTLEVEPSGNIRQKRTTGDNQNKDFEAAVPFLKEWQKVFVSRLTKEEKKLGILADEARIKEYKKLRKDGNKVWHGKLAGKLLVDVLEDDFMAAE